MKKSVIIFTFLLSILSFSSCRAECGNAEEVVANTPVIEASGDEPSAFLGTLEPETAQTKWERLEYLRHEYRR